MAPASTCIYFRTPGVSTQIHLHQSESISINPPHHSDKILKIHKIHIIFKCQEIFAFKFSRKRFSPPSLVARDSRQVVSSNSRGGSQGDSIRAIKSQGDSLSGKMPNVSPAPTLRPSCAFSLSDCAGSFLHGKITSTKEHTF